MPNRGELAIKATRSRRNAAEEDGIWTITGLCLIGALASIYFAANFQSFDGSLIAQIASG